MTTSKPPGGESLYRGPSKAPPRDKRERERDRRAQGGQGADEAPARSPPPRERLPLAERVHGPAADRAPAPAGDRSRAPAGDRNRAPATERPHVQAPGRPPGARDAATPKPVQEHRYYGLNACLSLFAHRPEALRKVWLLESRIPALKAVLAHCVKQRLGYTVVEVEDLERLSGSAHHEGVVFGAMPAAELSLAAWLAGLAPGPQLALWLDGVGNPHNFGAILRSAAHFGVAGALLSRESTLTLSGAAARVAEGGAEALPTIRVGNSADAVAELQAAGFTVAATNVRGGQSLYSVALPERVVLLMGAEQTGVDPALAHAATLKLLIPGTGAVESLNVASASSVLLSEWRRQQLQR